MKTISTIVLVIFYFNSFSQISLAGSTTSITLANNAPASVIDNAITLTGSVTIDGAKASISANFTSGDVLGFSAASLPTGVTGSYSSTTGVLTFTGNATPALYQTLLRTVTFNTTSSISTQRTVSFNLGTVLSYQDNGHFYEFIAGSFSWTTAKANAAAKRLYGLKGYLATITSQAENDFIQQKLAADGWIGASDDYTEINTSTGTSTFSSQSGTRPSEGKWYWVTGPDDEKGTQFSKNNTSPVAVSSRFMNWNSAEPNNSGTENYAEIYSSGSGSTGKWNDLGTASSLGYVVEYGDMPGDPVITLTSSRNIILVATQLKTSIAIVPYALQTPGTYVDNGIVFYSAGTTTDARVTISQNFKPGDVLSVSGSLPGGITSSYNSATGVLSFTGTATAAQWQSIFRSIKFNSTSTLLGDRDVTFSAGNLVSFNNGHFYEYVSTAGSWTTAKSSAAAKTYMGLQGYLTTITSQAENDFVTQKLAADAWIGATDDYAEINSATGSYTFYSQSGYIKPSEGKWYWVTGPDSEKGTQFSKNNTSPVAVNSAFMNWNSGEPNNVGSSEHYAEIYSSGASPGKWNDLPNSSSLGYVVEYGGLDSDPMVYLSASRTIAIDIALPITGMQFSADKDGTRTHLRWSTQTENNTLQYDIQHSTSGTSFTKIGSVPAAGTSDVLKTYQWTDEHPVSGINYYRLQQTDRDGRHVFSDVKVIVFPSEKIQLSPNPASSSITITGAAPTDKGSVRILDLNGHPVIKTKLQQGRQTINIASLPAGIYIAEVETSTLPVRIKFIKK